MRGKHHTARPTVPDNRSIPAYAGQTVLYCYVYSLAPVHPRVCGANFAVHCTFRGHYGPSPRMRGKRRQQRRCDRDFRSIPAYAGQTSSRSRWNTATPVHPRVCGANGDWCQTIHPSGGPSPRMRGKLNEIWRIANDKRSIPAYAGQTLWSGMLKGGPTVHPRVCGANPKLNMRRGTSSGPSPRMRGKLPWCR